MRVPMAIVRMTQPEDVHLVPPLTEIWGDQFTYLIIYQTATLDDETGEITRFWCQEHFVGNVWPAISETIVSRILLSSPVPLTLIVVSAILVDLDDTNHEDNVNAWDDEDYNPDDFDDFSDVDDDDHIPFI